MNPRFKSLKQLLSEGSHTILAGAKLIEAWRAADPTLGGRFIPRTWLRLDGRAQSALEKEQPLPTLVLAEALLKDLLGMNTPPPLSLWCELGPDAVGPIASRAIGLHAIQDPGNLGAILRSAVAFGFSEALLGSGCADPFSPKALRGSMGAAFLIRIRRVVGFEPDAAAWFALDSGPGVPSILDCSLAEPLRILIGNEGHGWKNVALDPQIRRCAIPTKGVESLNAAVAAGIACWEVSRRCGSP